MAKVWPNGIPLVEILNSPDFQIQAMECLDYLWRKSFSLRSRSCCLEVCLESEKLIPQAGLLGTRLMNELKNILELQMFENWIDDRN